MGRGFFAGTLWGALVGVIAVALASQVSDRRELSFPEPERTEVEVPLGTEFAGSRPETEPEAPAPDSPPGAERAPGAVTAPDPEIAVAPIPDTAPVAPPAVETMPLAPEGPAPVAEAPEVAVAEQGDSLPEATPPAPPAPTMPPESGPEVPATSQSALPAPEAPADDTIEVASAPDIRPMGAVPSGGLTAPAGPAPEVSADEIARPAPPEDDTAPAVAAAGEAAPRAEQVAQALPEPDTTPGTPTVPEAPSAPEAVQEPPATPERPEPPAAEAQALPRTDSENDVPEVRIIRVGQDDPEAETDSSDAEAAEDEAAVEPDPDAPAIQRFAAPFEPTGDALIAVVLLHEGAALPGPGTGLDLAAPISFGVDAGAGAARDIAAAYRAAEREVVMVPTLPPGAAPSDVEVALEVNFGAVPEAVALMDSPDLGFQSERAAVQQVVDAIGDTGHGLLTFPRGLNTAQQLAERAGVPARLVFRVLDDDGEDASAIRRTLDQAAFRARQEGVVILVGRTRPATVEALRGWLEAGLTGAQIVPVSAALLAQ